MGVNKGKGKAAKKAGKAVRVSRGRGKPVNLESLRHEISQRVGSQAVQMVETTIAEADKGHYGAMKYLFEMIGLYPSGGDETAAEPGEESLAKTLLMRIGLPEEPAAGAEANKECNPQQKKSPELP